MFPMSITLHTPAQLNAVLSALRPDLEASDFAHPAVGAAYVEARDRVAATSAAEPTTAQLVEKLEQRSAPAKKEAAAEQVEKPQAKPASTAAATTAGAAPGPRTAVAAAATDAPAKTAAASSPTAASAADAPQASTAAPEAIAYSEVAAAITAKVKVNRQKAVDTLAQFGAKKGTDLQPEQYAAFLAALEA